MTKIEEIEDLISDLSVADIDEIKEYCEALIYSIQLDLEKS